MRLTREEVVAEGNRCFLDRRMEAAGASTRSKNSRRVCGARLESGWEGMVLSCPQNVIVLFNRLRKGMFLGPRVRANGVEG